MNSTLRHKRHTTLRYKVKGTPTRPRLSVYRSLNHLYVQLIDDTSGKTLIGLSDIKLAPNKSGIERAKAVATEIAHKAKELKIETMVFDRGGFRYHGQVKQVADSLRESGITI